MDTAKPRIEFAISLLIAVGFGAGVWLIAFKSGEKHMWHQIVDGKLAKLLECER